MIADKREGMRIKDRTSGPQTLGQGLGFNYRKVQLGHKVHVLQHRICG